VPVAAALAKAASWLAEGSVAPVLVAEAALEAVSGLGLLAAG
jgi:hypothetical protein